MCATINLFLKPFLDLTNELIKKNFWQQGWKLFMDSATWISTP